MSQILESKNEEIRRLKAALYQSDTSAPKMTQGAAVCKFHPGQGSQYKVLEQRVIALKVCLFNTHAVQFYRTSVTEDVHNALQQALETERIRVRQLEAQNVHIPPADEDSGWDISANLQECPNSAVLGRVLPQSRTCSARLIAGPDRSCKTGRHLEPGCTAYQSTSASTSSAVSSCLTQKRSQFDQRGVSRVIQQPEMSGSSVLGRYRSSRRSHPREPTAPKKMMAAGRTIRQLGQQMIRDDQARQQLTRRAEDATAVVNGGYSDAGVAALMQQYSSLFAELGIQQSIVPGYSAAETKRCARHKPSGTPNHKKVDDEAKNQAAAGNSESLTKQKIGTLPLSPSHFGLSSVLAAASMVQHNSARHCLTPTRSVSLPCHKASFGLSAALQGVGSSYNRSSTCQKTVLKQAGTSSK